LKRLWYLFLMLFIGGCSSVMVSSPEDGEHTNFLYQAHAQNLAAISHWRLAGRISLDDGEQGGSGRLRWSVTPNTSELDFQGAMGRGAWRLSIDPQGALLREADGSEQHAKDVNVLIQQRIGWPIPLDALQWWVRGLAAPGLVEQKQLNNDGLLVSLEQFGWTVNFSRYDSGAGQALPVRLKATHENYRVKLAVSQWQAGSHGAGKN